MKKRFYRLTLLTALLMVILVFILKIDVLSGLLIKQSDAEKYRVLSLAISYIRDLYVEEPDARKTMEGGFKGMLDALDVLSCYLDKQQLDIWRGLRSNNYPDIGLILYKTFGSFPQVIGVREGSPAEKAGIKNGDFISAFDNRSTLTLSMCEANLMLKDSQSNPITLKVLRPDGTEDIVVKRKRLFDDCIAFTPLLNTSGILKIHHLFSCVDRIKDGVLPSLKDRSKPLILDLRNCNEGSLLDAQRLINLFIKAEKIGTFSNRKGQTDYLSCPADPELPEIPLIIWTNRGTIGPAEIVAAVLKDFKRAKIIGIQTPGLVPRQRVFPFEDGSGLILTTEIFNLQSGQVLWEKGVTPDERIDPQDDNVSFFKDTTQKVLASLS